MRITLIRHGQTGGNQENRYVGRTDEGLCEAGRRALLQREPEKSADLIYASPMKRCTQTAELLFPGQEKLLLPELREMDFGAFEYKNYSELAGNPIYQAWVDAGGGASFPEGEEMEPFVSRCRAGWEKLVEDAQKRKAASVAVVTHGGVIMVLMAYLIGPEEDIYRWHVGNGGGYELELLEEGARLLGRRRESSETQSFRRLGAETGAKE